MNLTIITADKTIGIGSTVISGIGTDMSWIPSDVHAVHWDGSTGQIEYNDGKSNVTMSEIGVYSQAETTFNNELKMRESPSPSSSDWDEDLRIRRNKKLTDCDWTRIDDNGLSGSKKTEWATYRQALRDLPANTSDSSDPTWPTEPS